MISPNKLYKLSFQFQLQQTEFLGGMPWTSSSSNCMKGNDVMSIPDDDEEEDGDNNNGNDDDDGKTYQNGMCLGCI